MVFTSGDRVLLHLLLKGDGRDPSGGAADQDDIAANCGIGRTHVPRALKPLIADDLVNETQGRAPGRTRRVKVYDLTEKGYRAAVALRDRANEAVIDWSDEDGNHHSEHCVDALRRINDQLGSRSMSQIPISLFLTVGRDKVGWNDILFLSSSVRGEMGEPVSLPEGWSPANPPDIPEELFGRTRSMKQLQTLLENNTLSALLGAPGMGKRTLVAAWARTFNKKILWLKKGNQREYSIDPGGTDLLVVLDTPVIDITSTLIQGSGVDLQDPRDDRWPEILRELKLLSIMEGDMVLEGDGIMVLEGLDEDPFVKEAVSSGLPEKFSLPFYKASRGSPTALAYLNEMDRSTLEKIGTLDEEAAIMSLVLGFRSRL